MFAGTTFCDSVHYKVKGIRMSIGHHSKIGASLPFVGSSKGKQTGKGRDDWQAIFSGVWGEVDVKPVAEGDISGSLSSRRVGDLTFNRIEFGNQQFEKANRPSSSDASFFSLSFPEGGEALCKFGDVETKLLPQNTYLINNGLPAKLFVEQNYSTFNVQIPTEGLENRLGRQANILSRPIVQPDAIFHMLQCLIMEMLENVQENDENAKSFLTNQMLDTVAFFLSSGGMMSEESLAMQSVRAKVLAYIDAKFRDHDLTPQAIADACGISRSYLYKVFFEGPSVMERLKFRRLEAARSLIEQRSPKLSMTDIAMKSGFSSSSEFSRLFKNEFGVAPSRF